MKNMIFILAVSICMTACNSKSQSLTVDEFEKAILKSKVIVVDVRTPQEFAESHIAGAINIDWKSGNFAEQADELLDDDYRIALYCKHGKRSKLAAQLLQQMEYRKIIELQDGLDAWIKAGKPVWKSGEPVAKPTLIPYIEADNYFVRNDAALPVPSKIASQEEFDRYFGMAATMGEGGRPTVIDFTKQFVLAVVLPATNADIEPDDERLVDDGETLTFEYSVDRDNELNSYTQTPLLLIIVDRQYERENVVLKEVKDR